MRGLEAMVASFMALSVACDGRVEATAAPTDSGAPIDASTSLADARVPPQCSDGPRWPRGTSFEYEEHGPVDAPRCVPHCGPNQSASAMWPRGPLTSDALPSGACAEADGPCTMTAEWLGPCPPEGLAHGPLDLFICRCRSGSWSCTVDATSPSATTWTCTMPDAGADDAG